MDVNDRLVPNWYKYIHIVIKHSISMPPMSKYAKNRIREHREALELSRAALATLVGTAAAQIQKLENGTRKLTQGWMDRLAPHLGCRPADLLPITEGSIHQNVSPEAIAPILGSLLSAFADSEPSTDQIERLSKPLAGSGSLLLSAVKILQKLPPDSQERAAISHQLAIAITTHLPNIAMPGKRQDEAVLEFKIATNPALENERRSKLLENFYGFDETTKAEFWEIARALASDPIVNFDENGRALIKSKSLSTEKQIVPDLGRPSDKNFYIPRNRREYLSWNPKQFTLINPAGPNSFAVEAIKPSSAGQINPGDRFAIDPDAVPTSGTDVFFLEKLHTQAQADAYFFAIDLTVLGVPKSDLWGYGCTAGHSDGRLTRMVFRPRARLALLGVVVEQLQPSVANAD